ncbi:MAG: xanthine dehydrogenase family protein subunit M [Thermogemmatispora sp.]|jgi:CO/xanthine dehydrogenase FAD-binding subunit|uniref:Carbon monoxide dehydrogenase n=1 Tax=Thermogemmatispora aurantia TaxID=2045279 RepID=A0A5J4K9Y7_9CHLR|nr:MULTISPECIES: xanthine dehydrogenase family protein subunit M [Thermogemmatispora]MBE3564318.1 xanthine dehydrogenase family protein subunit M [Thermogemmatispora sp.]GER83507.1 carbon monoxide dehydrogenase [Thermogemmatispora aurantia]
MKPPRFQYCAPRLLDDALDLLDHTAEEAKILAGGQSLMPLLNMRLARPAYLLDINHISELHYIEEERDYLAIGAVTRQRQVERSPAVQQKHPLLVEVIRHIGHFQIRNRGTVAGSIAHADPAAELPALLVCLDGMVVAQSAHGERLLPAADFFQGYLTTELRPNEMVTEVRFPWLPPAAGWAFAEFARRSGDYALAGAIVVLTAGPDGRCSSARLSYLGVAPVPQRASAVEALLVGTTLDAATLEEAAAAARTLVSEEMQDIHATAEYRRELVADLTRRLLPLAWSRCSQARSGPA